jgi:flagellar protein FlhE
MKTLLKFTLSCILALMVVSEAWAGAGAYSSTTVGPNVYSKNWIVTSTFNPVGSFPPGSYINGNLYWNYSTSYRPVGFEAYLCWDSTYAECINITNLQSGSTTAFQGRTPNHSFVLLHRVVGTGTLSPPVYGNSDQIIVNFAYP